jgi:2-oxoisovalerate dehydrogenase E1 component
MENFFFPQPEWLIDAIHEKIIPLKGHTCKTDYSVGKSLKLNREGV